MFIIDGWEKRPRYATLSHCCGNIDFIRLKQELTGFFINAIPLKNLTKIFRDPVEITQNLGLDYLWIDSLCIIRNSDFDWGKESGMMGSIYGGSTVNNAASGAIDGHSGCFVKPGEYVGKVHFTTVIEGRGTAWNVAPKIFISEWLSHP